MGAQRVTEGAGLSSGGSTVRFLHPVRDAMGKERQCGNQGFGDLAPAPLAITPPVASPSCKDMGKSHLPVCPRGTSAGLGNSLHCFCQHSREERSRIQQMPTFYRKVFSFSM